MAINILITGCTGFLGQNFIDPKHVQYLASNLDAKLVCLARRAPHARCESPHLVYFLIPEPASVSVKQYRELIEKCKIEAIVHMAALVGEGKGRWEDYVKVNVKWTLSLARAFVTANVYHHVFVYISTVGVHGTIPRELPANEETPYAPDNYYHTSKALAEKALIEMATNEELPLLILRPTIMYGKYDKGFLWRVLRLSRRFFLPVPSNLRVHLLDVETAVSVIDALLLKPSKSNVLIVADREPVKLKDLLSFLSDRIPNTRFVEVPDKFMQMMESFMAPLKRYANIALLCRSWYYDVHRLKLVSNVELSDTLNGIRKYTWWYARAC
jgi:nucleoside-diphosphate-sugar epimerase